jgi:Flp pilus assembly protein TadB
MFESSHMNLWGEFFPATLILIAVIGMFILAAIFLWTKQRRRERTAFYDHELVRRLAERGEISEDGALEMIREQAAEEHRRRREGLRVAGIINVAVGLGILVFFTKIEPEMMAVAVIPIFVGVALLVSAFLPRAKA